MTRIIAGVWGGRRLSVPRVGVRPTSDRVRESVFNWLDHRLGGWQGCTALDLYAGSGALGIEAVSRGADAAVLVERDRAAVSIIRRNIADLAAEDVIAVRQGPVDRVARDRPVTCQVVFADPPYDVPSGDVASVLAAYDADGWIAPGAMVVVETGRRSDAPWPAGFTDLERRRYGDTAIWYGRRHTPVPGEED